MMKMYGKFELSLMKLIMEGLGLDDLDSAKEVESLIKPEIIWKYIHTYIHIKRSINEVRKCQHID